MEDNWLKKATELGIRKQSKKREFNDTYIGRDIFKKAKELGYKGYQRDEYLSVCHAINRKIQELLLNNDFVVLPWRMGKLELRVKTQVPKLLKDGTVQVFKAINWKETLKLWTEDEEARRSKKYIRFENSDFVRVLYNKHNCDYTNRNNMKFHTTKPLRKALYRLIKEGQLLIDNILPL